MTPHQTITLPDLSVAVRIYPGGRWKVRRGSMNGGGKDVYDCDACKFVDEQNRFVRSFHAGAVRGYLGEGEAA